MIEFRKAKHDVSGFITIQYRQAAYEIEIDGTLRFQTNDDGELVYGPWQDVPYINQYSKSDG